MTTFQKLILFFTITVFISCEQTNQSITKTTTTSIDSIQAGDTIIKTNDTLVIKQKDRLDTIVRYYPIPDSLYHVETNDIKFNGKLDFTNYEYKKLYYTAIKTGVIENRVNFAGHFCFIYWGCGSPCKLSAVVDMKTGKVYNGLASATGYDFRKDSRLIVINPPDSTNWYSITTPQYHPETFEWTGQEFKRLK